MRKLENTLKIFIAADGRNGITDNYYQTDFGFVIPKGFETDFASVPRLLHVLLPRMGRYTVASVVHDYIYRTPSLGYTRYEADNIFLKQMETDNVGFFNRNMLYAGVRAGGMHAWLKQRN